MGEIIKSGVLVIGGGEQGPERPWRPAFRAPRSF